uniref:Uncharacterized protein n=1 Tax=Homalodisca liturata TaxID=320908 RepID=A0A1B6HUD9_9HEMI
MEMMEDSSIERLSDIFSDSDDYVPPSQSSTSESDEDSIKRKKKTKFRTKRRLNFEVKPNTDESDGMNAVSNTMSGTVTMLEEDITFDEVQSTETDRDENANQPTPKRSSVKLLVSLEPGSATSKKRFTKLVEHTPIAGVS